MLKQLEHTHTQDKVKKSLNDAVSDDPGKRLNHNGIARTVALQYAHSLAWCSVDP